MDMDMGPVDPLIAGLPLSDPRCRNESCNAFLDAENESQAAVSWAYQFEYGHWVTYYYVIIIGILFFVHAARTWRDKRARIDDSRSTSSIHQRIMALARFISYRRITQKPLDRLGLPSCGMLTFLLTTILFLVILMFAVKPYYREHMGYGSPPLAIRTGLMAFACTPILIALAGKANIVTLLTGISHEKLNVVHQWTAWISFGLALAHTIPFFLHSYWDGPFYGVSGDKNLSIQFYAYGTGGGTERRSTACNSIRTLHPLPPVHSKPFLRDLLFHSYLTWHNIPWPPVSGMTLTQQEALQQKIEELAVPKTITPALESSFKFWVANLTIENALKLKSESVVASIVNDVIFADDSSPQANVFEEQRTEAAVNGKVLDFRANPGDIQAQSDKDPLTSSGWPSKGASKALVIISKPENARLGDQHNYYYKTVDPNMKTTIYIMDVGVNPNHPEYSNMPGNKRFLWVDFTNPTDTSNTESDPDGHGSCVYSLAMSPTFGTAKLADAVIVKMPYRPSADGLLLTFLASDIFLSLQKILEDVQRLITHSGITRNRFVVNMSLGGPSEAGLIEQYKNLLSELIKYDVVIVCASGNDRKWWKRHAKVDKYPAAFWQSLDIVVVGAVNNRGERALFSEGTYELTTSAPGVKLACANQYMNYMTRSGTSMATPLVAGVVANLLSDPEYDSELHVPGQVAKNVKNLLKKLHYKRSWIGPKVVWNGVNGVAARNSP